MKNTNNLLSILTFDWEDYDYLNDLIERDRNDDNSNELDKLVEKLRVMKELYENS